MIKRKTIVEEYIDGKDSIIMSLLERNISRISNNKTFIIYRIKSDACVLNHDLYEEMKNTSLMDISSSYSFAKIILIALEGLGEDKARELINCYAILNPFMHKNYEYDKTLFKYYFLDGSSIDFTTKRIS